MTNLMPRRNKSLFDAFMMDPFDAFFPTAPITHSTQQQFMRTDIRQDDNGYELTIDLPGFTKENVHAELKDGVLSITAETSSQNEEKNEQGTYIRKERFSGKCSRSYYVGDDIEESDIKARFDNGTLKITVPKKQPVPEIEATTTINIEG